MAASLANWSGNIVFGAPQHSSPASLPDLQSTVAHSTKVRALGSRHSFSDIADTTGVLVRLDDMPSVFEIDTAAATVKVSANMRYAELAQRLHAQGWAVHNLASLPHISIAGACATATHGSGVGNRNLATSVSALELVTAEGDLVTLSRDEDGDQFQGAVVGLGALGVVVSITLDLVPAFEMAQNVYQNLPFAALDDHYSEIVSSAYSVSLFTDWRGPLINQVWVKRRVDSSAPAIDGDWFGARPATVALNPVPGVSGENCTEQFGVPGPWHERLPHFRSEFTPSAGEELQSEYFVPREHAVAAVHALSGIADRIAPVLQISEFRTIAADTLWMSPAYRQDVSAFHFTWIKDVSAVTPVLGLIEERLAPYSVRPHWGKLFTTPPAVLRARFERLADFQALVRQYDPTGKFTNDFLARTVFADS